MRYKLHILVLLVAISSGCVSNRKFFADCRPAVPVMRDYAISHLPALSESDKQVIATTEPSLAQANYIQVYFGWSNICTVVSGPPPCQPLSVMDWRSK
jgi:hypothetical protein